MQIYFILGLTPKDWTPTGSAQVTSAVLKDLAGTELWGEDPGAAVWGKAFSMFAGGAEGEEACRAM